MRKFFKENDIISAEVQQVGSSDGKITLQTRNLKYGKVSFFLLTTWLACKWFPNESWLKLHSQRQEPHSWFEWIDIARSLRDPWYQWLHLDSASFRIESHWIAWSQVSTCRFEDQNVPAQECNRCPWEVSDPHIQGYHYQNLGKLAEGRIRRIGSVES